MIKVYVYYGMVHVEANRKQCITPKKNRLNCLVPNFLYITDRINFYVLGMYFGKVLHKRL